VSTEGAGRGPALPWRAVVAVIPGTLLNPLNSSMIAVALVDIERAFRVGTDTATWVVSAFYLAAAVGMPLMGRLADRVGPRRVFTAGLVLVAAASTGAVVAPSFAWLVVGRILQALGTSAAYPSALALFRRLAGDARAPARALGALSIASSVSAALGPVLGGLLVSAFGWPAIFLVNVPVVAAGLVLAVAWLPSDRRAEGRAQGVLTFLATELDLAGVVLFAVAVASLLAFVLSLPRRLDPWLLAAVAASGALLPAVERRARLPFLDIGLLVQNRRLMSVFLQFAAVNVAFYGVFYGLPLWLEEVRRVGPSPAGLLLLPTAGAGVLTTPLAARAIERRGVRTALLIGYGTLLLGSAALLTLGPDTHLLGLVAAGAVLGIPNGFNNLGLQAALYEAAPADRMGQAGGQLQTFRYVGAILSVSLLGFVFSRAVTTGGFHLVAAVLAAVSLTLVAVALGDGRRGR
jgi:MFS family permease